MADSLKRYRWGVLNYQLDESIKLPFNRNAVIPKPGSQVSEKKLFEGLVRAYENQGYPFVSVKLVDVRLEDELVDGQIVIEPGPLVYLDSIVIRSDLNLSLKVLQQIAGIKKGAVYNEAAINRASKRIAATGFLRNEQALEVGFFQDKAWVYLTPAYQASNAIDALLAFAPGKARTGLFSISGQVNMDLSNIFKQAEQILIDWEAPGGGTQTLTTALAFPYLFGLPIGVSGQLDLYKQDSSYLNLTTGVGFRLSLMPRHWLDIQWKQQSSDGLTVEHSESYHPFEIQQIAFSYYIDLRDDPLFPRRGLAFKAGTGLGQKIYPDQMEPDLSTNHTEADASLQFHQTLTSVFGLFIKLETGYRSGQNLAENELFRLGGAKSIRGFPEQSLLASQYVAGSTEVRLFIGDGSHIHVFADLAYLSVNQLEQCVGQPVTGFGAGLGLKTRAGILKLDYAVGMSQNQNLALQNGFVHLGIQSIF